MQSSPVCKVGESCESLVSVSGKDGSSLSYDSYSDLSGMNSSQRTAKLLEDANLAIEASRQARRNMNLGMPNRSLTESISVSGTRNQYGRFTPTSDSVHIASSSGYRLPSSCGCASPKRNNTSTSSPGRRMYTSPSHMSHTVSRTNSHTFSASPSVYTASRGYMLPKSGCGCGSSRNITASTCSFSAVPSNRSSPRRHYSTSSPGRSSHMTSPSRSSHMTSSSRSSSPVSPRRYPFTSASMSSPHRRSSPSRGTQSLVNIPDSPTRRALSRASSSSSAVQNARLLAALRERSEKSRTLSPRRSVR